MATTANPDSPAATKSTAKSTAAESNEAPIILQLANASRSRIRQLLRGEGAILNDVTIAIDELRTRGVLAGAVRPVIVVVKEKSEDSGWFF